MDTATAKFVSVHSDTAKVVSECPDSLSAVHNASGEHVTAKVVVEKGRTDEKKTARENTTVTKRVGVDTTTIHYVSDAVKRTDEPHKQGSVPTNII